MNQALAPRLHDLLTAGEPVVLVEVAVAKGSTPREAGAVMLVTATACLGTIGGGRLEWEGIAGARQLLDEGGHARLLELPLGPAVGQCCGGHVTLRLVRAGAADLGALEAAERAAAAGLPLVLLFG
ncbi:MAG: XdhC family protein, partial [Geminicoccaceae bacterium]